jgi:hypothetical protein
MAEEKVVVTVRIEAGVHKAVKIAAAERGVTVGGIYETGARRMLREMGPKGSKDGKPSL